MRGGGPLRHGLGWLRRLWLVSLSGTATSFRVLASFRKVYRFQMNVLPFLSTRNGDLFFEHRFDYIAHHSSRYEDSVLCASRINNLDHPLFLPRCVRFEQDTLDLDAFPWFLGGAW